MQDVAPYILVPMSIVAEQLDERLRQLDPQAAAHLERLVRELLALTQPSSHGTAPGSSEERTSTMAAIAAIAEPMGTMTNEDIDRAVYGE